MKLSHIHFSCQLTDFILSFMSLSCHFFMTLLPSFMALFKGFLLAFSILFTLQLNYEVDRNISYLELAAVSDTLINKLIINNNIVNLIYKQYIYILVTKCLSIAPTSIFSPASSLL